MGKVATMVPPVSGMPPPPLWFGGAPGGAGNGDGFETSAKAWDAGHLPRHQPRGGRGDRQLNVIPGHPDEHILRMERHFDPDFHDARGGAERVGGFAVGDAADTQVRALFRVQHDAAKRRHDVDVIEGRTGDPETIRLVKPGMN